MADPRKWRYCTLGPFNGRGLCPLLREPMFDRCRPGHFCRSHRRREAKSFTDPVRGGCPVLVCSAPTVYMRPIHLSISTLIRRQTYCVACLAWWQCKRHSTYLV